MNNGLELGASGIIEEWPSIRTQKPKAYIELYEESVVMRRCDSSGAITSSYEVSPKALATAFSGENLTTGLLPRNSLFYCDNGAYVRLGIVVPAQKQTLFLKRSGRETKITIPLPPLLFVGAEHEYWIFALKSDWPTDENTSLFKAPFSNIYDGNRICKGNVEFPVCSKGTIEKALKLYFESYFNGDLIGGRSRKHQSVISLYEEIENTEKYPLNDLIPTSITLKEVVDDTFTNSVRNQ